MTECDALVLALVALSAQSVALYIILTMYMEAPW